MCGWTYNSHPHISKEKKGFYMDNNNDVGCFVILVGGIIGGIISGIIRSLMWLIFGI